MNLADFENAATVEEVTERRWHRVGACPVLEVSVTYPRLYVREGTEGAISPVDAGRFNDAYARMAEAFLSWAAEEPARAAAEAFLSLGAGAAYRFDRRLILCKMTASIVRDSRRERVEYLRVERHTAQGTKRQGNDEKIIVNEDIWRVPSLTLVRRSPRTLRFCEDDACRR